MPTSVLIQTNDLIRIDYKKPVKTHLRRKPQHIISDNN